MAEAKAGVKLNVTGIAQFKQNITTARNQIKTMDADLALIEKNFKKTGDAEEYMQAKTEVLKGKLDQQKKIIEETERALDTMTKQGVTPASAAYQNMQQQLLRAKGDLIDTEQAMAGISEKGEDAASGVSLMNKRLSEINKNVSFENVVNGLEKITDGMGKVIQKAWNVGKAIVTATLGAGEWADELQTTADQYEIRPEDLYKMHQVATQIDTDAETILEAQDRLSKNRSQASEGFMGAMAKLGLNPDGMTTDQLFWTAGEAIRKLGKEEDKAYYATQVFGKSWRELLPLFNAGKKKYDELMGSASWVGDTNFEALKQMNDQQMALSNEWETLQKTFLGTLAGPMTDVMEILTGLLEQFNAYLQSDEGKQAMKELGDALTGWVGELKNLNPADVINTVKEGFNWIVTEAPNIIEAIKGFGIAFAGLKLGELGINIGRIVTGFKGLLQFGGGGGGTTGADVVTGGGGPMKIWKGSTPSVSGMTNGAAFMDWFINNTPMGRQAENKLRNLVGLEGRFGDEDVFGDVKQNASTFASDWDSNIFTQLGKNSILYWDKIHRQLGEANEWMLGDDVTSGEAMEFVRRMSEQTDDLNGATEAQTQTTKDLKDAADNLRNTPAEMKQAVIDGMAAMGVYIDGQKAGTVLTPYIGGVLGNFVLNNP